MWLLRPFILCSALTVIGVFAVLAEVVLIEQFLLHAGLRRIEL